jgi:hypothetical protein
MKEFGPSWSGGAQLLWTGGSTGAVLDLLVEIPQDGAWVVELALTRAPDYAQLQFEVDQHPVEKRFDAYAPQVEAPASLLLGSFAMRAGPRRVSILISGKQHVSAGWLVGIDRVRLTRMSGQ